MLAEFIQLPKEGETIGPYFLREVLSSSILGAFYQATHKLKHEDVLIHILPEALMRADSRFQQRYKEAVEKQGKLPAGPAMGAVELHRIGGNLVVQYPPGNYRSLNKIILKQEERFSETKVQQLLTAIAKGLTEAQKIDQGHYFMTPDFLFLNEEGSVRVAGIGLFESIQYESFERFVSGAVIPVSGDNKRNFTALEILSPEIRNFKARDLRSDFYCLGMCAYFMLTGEKPERRWAAPTKARRELSEGWDLFISQCLEPKPTDRFSNYKAFLADLENITELPSRTARKKALKSRRKLTRIPLPQALEKLLTMRWLMQIRLILLGLAGLLVIATASMFIHILYTDDADEVTDRPIRRVHNADDANLIIEVTPDNATLSVMGPMSGRFQPKGNAIYLSGQAGKYTVQAQSPRYRTITRQVELDRSGPTSLTMNLVPEFANVHVNGAVGTEVYLMPHSGMLLHIGTITSIDGLDIDKRLLTGRHQLVGLHKQLLPAVAEEVPMGVKPVRITFDQPAKPTVLTVTSNPEGAVVTVDGARLGLTPLKVDGLQVGRHMQLRVEKDGYRAIERELQFELGEEITVDAGDLEAKIGSLTYKIDLGMPNPPDMRELMLSINGVMLLVEETGTLELPEGGHMVKLEHPDYYPFDERIVVIDRKETVVNMTLEPRPVRLLPVIAKDVPARFYVDGNETTLTGQGLLQIDANRPVEVEVMIRDHLNVIQTFHGVPNERREWEVPLKPIPGPVPGEEWSTPYFDIEMVWLPAAEYQMGSPLNEFRRLPNEDSLTNVRLTSGFWIGIHEVTQDVYESVMRENPSQFKGTELPVDSVSWDKAGEFCQRLTIYERDSGRLPAGFAYRLPTEAEWEYAARAGTRTPFSFGDTASPEDGNFHGFYEPGKTGGERADQRYGTLVPGSFEPNAFGLHDVHGNVSEWTLDRYWDRHPGRTVVDPVNTERGRGYTVKGGSWSDTADRVRSAAREGVPGSSVRNSLGFRIVLAPEVKVVEQ